MIWLYIRNIDGVWCWFPDRFACSDPSTAINTLNMRDWLSFSETLTLMGEIAALIKSQLRAQQKIYETELPVRIPFPTLRNQNAFKVESKRIWTSRCNSNILHSFRVWSWCLMFDAFYAPCWVSNRSNCIEALSRRRFSFAIRQSVFNDDGESEFG